MEPQRPLPQPHEDDLPFWEAARRHELRLPCCRDCGESWWPASPVCPGCLSDRIEWAPVSGRGRVTSWVVFHKAYFPAFADRIPYNVAWVELEEGPRLPTNLVNVANAAIRIGMPVRVTFQTLDYEWTLPLFEPIPPDKEG